MDKETSPLKQAIAEQAKINQDLALITAALVGRLGQKVRNEFGGRTHAELQRILKVLRRSVQEAKRGKRPANLQQTRRVAKSTNNESEHRERH